MGREEEREGRKHHTGDLDCNLGMCPLDSEWNWQPYALQSDVQATEPHQPGLNF